MVHRVDAAVQSGLVQGGLPVVQADLARLGFWHPCCFKDDQGLGLFTEQEDS